MAFLMPERILPRFAIFTMMLVTYASLLVVCGIVFVLSIKSFYFFQKISLWNVFLQSRWSLQENLFSVYPLLLGTLLIVSIAVGLASPVALMASIYISEYMPKKYINRVRPLLEVITGIPTVVYGVLAILLVAPTIKSLGDVLHLHVSGESGLAAGITMGFMLIPFMVSLFTDALQAVPAPLREGARALGSTKAETTWYVVLPVALIDILGVVLLAISRGIGETMIVVMATGLTANFSFNPFETVTTITVQIVSVLLGDQDYSSPKVLVAFVLGLLLFCFTLALNTLALSFIRRKRGTHE